MYKKRSDKYLIERMLESGKQVIAFTNQISFNDFENDVKTVLAVLHLVQIIGEAAGNISKTFQNETPQIEWEKIIKSRHVIVHHYDEVRLETVWRIVTQYIPLLINQLENLIRTLPEEK